MNFTKQFLKIFYDLSGATFIDSDANQLALSCVDSKIFGFIIVVYEKMLCDFHMLNHITVTDSHTP